MLQKNGLKSEENGFYQMIDQMERKNRGFLEVWEPKRLIGDTQTR